MYNCEIIKGTEDGEVRSEMTLFIMRSMITALALLCSGGGDMIFRQLSFSFSRCLGGGLSDVSPGSPGGRSSQGKKNGLSYHKS